MPLTDSPEAQPTLSFQNLKQRLLGINRLFLFTVFFPTTFAIIYFSFFASDIYISESHFVIRSPQKQQSIGLGDILKGSGVSKGQDEAYTVEDYICSRDALRELNNKFDISESFASPTIDRPRRFLGVFWWDKSFEALYRYYLWQIVDIETDSTSSISILQVRAFTADQANKINEGLLEMSERLVNKLNDRGRQDMIRFARAEVALAENKVKAASLALAAYRNKKGVFDPEKQSALQLQQISKLQDELIVTKTQLAQVRMVTKNNPQVPVLQQRVELLQAEIAAETSKVAGGDRSLSEKSASYHQLALEHAFADKQLATALASLEQARNDATHKQLYLERIVQPDKPDKAMEPRRVRAVFATFVLGMVCWGILSMLLAGVREHHD